MMVISGNVSSLFDWDWALIILREEIRGDLFKWKERI